MKTTLNMNATDFLSISGGRGIGFDLQKCWLLLAQAKNKSALSYTVMNRIEKTLEARKAK